MDTAPQINKKSKAQVVRSMMRSAFLEGNSAVFQALAKLVN